MKLVTAALLAGILASSAIICFGSVLVPAEGMLLGPSKTSDTVLSGNIRFSHPDLDIGRPMDLLDGKYETLIRTPSINPAFIEFVLEQPVSFYGIRVVTIAAKHDYTLAAAENDEDLASKSGSYRVLAKGTTDSSGDIIYSANKSVSYAAFRLDLKRLEGDDYVHITEWEFLQPIKLKSMKVDYKVRTSHGGDEKAEYKPLTEDSTRPEDSLFIPRVTATLEDGRELDATKSARIDYNSKYGKPWLDGPGFEFTKPEKVEVTVNLGELSVKGNVLVTPRVMENRQMDLDVLYVERLPRIDFDASNGGWPLPGQNVTWRAHVQNWGEKAVNARYIWTLDDNDVKRAKITVPAGEIITVDLPWQWEQKRHSLAFKIEPIGDVTELVTGNNRVQFDTDALAVGFYVDRSYADQFHEHQYKLGLDDSNSFADWGQRVIRQWNKMLNEAKHPQTPDGALDRVRLDLVKVVPDQAVPFQGGDWPTNFPNLEEKSVDLLWGFPYKYDQWQKPLDIEAMKKSIAEGKPQTHWFCLDLALIHELNHARYLVDSYGFDVHVGDTDPEKSNIRIRDDEGRWIVGLYLQKEGIVHSNRYVGQMGGSYEHYSAYEIAMWNRVAGQRARTGNCNGTSDIGVYLQDIPKQFKIKFIGPNGVILADDPVKVYWAAPQDGWYGKMYDNVPDAEYRTDSNGEISADATFFSKDGKIIHTWGHSNAVPIVRIDHQGKTYYVFVEVSDVNMLANLSKEEIPTLEVKVPLREGEPVQLPADYERIMPVDTSGK